MRHAGPATLARIAPLLEALRARPGLRETRPGVFSLESRAFLHFHDDPSGIFADVRLGAEFVRLPVTTASEQSDLLERIDARVSAVERRKAGRRRRPRGALLALLAAGALAAQAGCGAGDISEAPSPVCQEAGAQCRLSESTLGVCERTRCGPDATPPCFECVPQH